MKSFSNGPLKIKEVVLVNTDEFPSLVDASETRVQPGASELGREEMVSTSPLVSGGHQPKWPQRLQGSRRSAQPCAWEQLSSLEEENLLSTAWPPTHQFLNTNHSSYSLIFLTQTLISAIIKVQTQCEDPEKDVASEVTWKTEELANELINVDNLKFLLFLNRRLFLLSD